MLVRHACSAAGISILHKMNWRSLSLVRELVRGYLKAGTITIWIGALFSAFVFHQIWWSPLHSLQTSFAGRRGWGYLCLCVSLSLFFLRELVRRNATFFRP